MMVFKHILAGSAGLCAVTFSPHQAAAQETAFAQVPSDGEQIVIGENSVAIGGGTDTQFSVGLVSDLSFGGLLIEPPTPVDMPFFISGGETLSTSITGSFNQLIKVGGGVATLSAANEFGNGVIIEAGRLRAERAEFLTNNTIENLGEVEFFADSVLPVSTFRGTITGTGDLIKTGGGRVRIEIPTALSGDLRTLYSGDTRIDAGVLEIGGSIDASQSSLVIADGASLVLDNSDIAAFAALNGFGTIEAVRNTGATELVFGHSAVNGDFSGAISGSLRLRKVGENTQILRGENGFSELTTIEAGTLSLFGGASLPDAMPVFITQGTLLFNDVETIASIDGNTSASVGIFEALTLSSDTFESDYEGSVFGAGVLRIDGGVHKFRGAHTHSGATLVNAGHLVLSGQTQSAIQVASGARLTANNAVNADVVNAGQVDISDGTNRLRIGGDFTQVDTGTLALILRPTTGDQLVVEGAASIDGDIHISITPDFSYTIGTQWTLIDAPGGLTIAADVPAPDISTFVQLETAQTATQLNAALVRVPYSVAAQTPLQAQVAAAFQTQLLDLDRSAAATATLNMLETMSLDDVSVFFSDLSGEQAAPTMSVIRTLAAQVQNDMLLHSRLAAQDDLNGWRLWGDVQTVQNVRTLEDGQGRVTADIYQLITGAAAKIGQTSWAGFALGYGQAAGLGAQNTDAFTISASAGTDLGVFSLAAVAGFTHLSGAGGEALAKEGSALFAQAQISSSLRLSKIDVVPHASVTYSQVSRDEGPEQSIGQFTASTLTHTAHPVTTAIGIDAYVSAELGTAEIRPFLRATYRALLSERTDRLERRVSGLETFSFDTGSLRPQRRRCCNRSGN